MEPITLQEVMSFRVMHALCDIRKGQLHSTHYACVLYGGNRPVWGIFSAATGKLLHYGGPRSQVEGHYPKKVWRVKEASWVLSHVSERIPEYDDRIEALKAEIRRLEAARKTHLRVV